MRERIIAGYLRRRLACERALEDFAKEEKGSLRYRGNHAGDRNPHRSGGRVPYAASGSGDRGIRAAYGSAWIIIDWRGTAAGTDMAALSCCGSLCFYEVD